jgi:hypothetical protein
MNVETETEAAQFPEKEYINGTFLAVWSMQLAYLIINTSIILPFKS